MNGIRASCYSSLGVFSHKFAHLLVMLVYSLVVFFKVEKFAEDYIDIICKNDK